MKKAGGLILCVLLGFSFLQSAYVGKVYFRASNGERLGKVMVASQPRPVSQMIRGREARTGSLLQGKLPPAKSVALGSPAYIAREVGKGNLKLKRADIDRVAGMEHRRYTQCYQGLEVLGGQVIQHFRSGKLVSTTGEYYEGISIDTTPFFDANTAIQLYRIHLARPEDPEKPLHNNSNFNLNSKILPKDSSKLIIYPVTDRDSRLAYQVVVYNGHLYSMTGIVDAKSGETIKEYSNVQSEDLTIGVGIGVHGEQFKLPTTYQDNLYYLADLTKARPVNQLTYDSRNGYYVASDSDNEWVHDGALVNAHAYLGLSYDYYYTVLGRHGIDDANLDMLSIVHDPDNLDNASWSGFGINQMSFGDPGPSGWQTAAALDVVSHEYSHGVTEFTSGLEYYCDANAQPGALNESFSDIMGTAIESYWQTAGQAFDRFDWVVGEDVFSSFSSSNYLRSLSNPNSKIGMVYESIAYPYPCHLSQCYLFPNTQEGDWGGVHFLATLYGHAYYLLAAGGTNSVSGLSVSSIGIDKATKIFYRAWTYYLTPTASFLNAANCLLQSASDLYGASSNERAQTLNAMYAIGW